MLNLILILIVVWLVLTLVLAAWTMWFQGYIYSEPVGDIYWRAPAAGTALALYLVVWVLIAYRAPGRYVPLHEFTSAEDTQYPELRVPGREGKEEVYKLRKTPQGRPEYYRGSDRIKSRPEKIIIVEGDQRHVFEPERDAKGNYQVRADGSLWYKDEAGREMSEANIGQVRVKHGSWVVVDLLLNFLFLAVWWLCLWLLLRFQWSHALGLAVAFWGVTLLFVLPPVLGQVDAVARQRGVSALVVPGARLSWGAGVSPARKTAAETPAPREPHLFGDSEFLSS